jgi:Bacteriophage Sf6, terminase small subunit-like
MLTSLDARDRKLSETQPYEIEPPRGLECVRRGRPSLYTDELGAEICRRISIGQSVVEIGRDPDMPCRQAIHEWIVSNRNGFGDMFARAREAQAEVFVDQIIDIADSVAGCTDNAAVQAARLRVDARKWIAARLLPRKYGDRVGLASSGSVVVRVVQGLGDEPER